MDQNNFKEQCDKEMNYALFNISDAKKCPISLMEGNFRFGNERCNIIYPILC